MAQTAALFTGTAMPDRDWWQALWPDPAGMLTSIDITPDMTVVDLCCGDGFFTAPLSRLVNGRVYGVDLDPSMLAQTQQEVQRIGAPPCRLIEGDAFEIASLVLEKVDYALLANTFHGVPDKTAVAKVVCSVLKDNGCFGIINWYPKPREETPVLGKPRGPATELRMSPEQVCKVVEPSGLTLRRVVDLPPYHYGAVFIRSDTTA